MKVIVFRPLRRIKKTGKIVVASYAQWRKIKTADYQKFTLVIDSEYKTFPGDELVFNHNGENLFWSDFDPEEIPYLPPFILQGEDFVYPKKWRVNYGMGYSDNFSAEGLDCSGVPMFSHGTAHYLTIGNMRDYTLEDVDQVLNPMNKYELLRVDVVAKWVGWFLYQLRNNELVFKSN